MNNLFQYFSRFYNQINAKNNQPYRKTPTRLQMEFTECGAASLGIILQYYGRYVPLTQLRESCGVSRDGSDAANLVLAAAKYGLKAKGFKKGLKALKQLSPPAILFWEFNHFLVFEGFVGDKVFLNDPALGPRTVTLDEFEASYTGIVLTLTPEPGFQKLGSPPSIWPIVLRRLFSEPGGTLFILIVGILLILPQLTMPIFSQIYLDEVINNNMANWLKPMLWAMALTIVVQAIFEYLQLLGGRKLEKRLTRRFSVNFEHKMLSLPESYYKQRYASDVAVRMESNSSISEFIASKLLPTLTGLVSLVFYLILTFLYSPLLGLLILSTTGLNALVIKANLRAQKDDSLKIQKDGAKAESVVVSAMTNMETIKAGALEEDIFRRFSGYQSRLLNTTQSIQLRNMRLTVFPSVLTTINEISVFVLGFFLVLQGQLTLGMLLAAQTIAFTLKSSIESIIKFVQELPEFEAELLRLEDVLEQPNDPLVDNQNQNLADDMPATRLTGSIQLNNINFGYVKIKDNLINNFNLTIHPGQRIAFVGGSGSGKSTLAKLIAGLYQPNDGEILFDGMPLLSIPRAITTGSLAMVQQEIALYGCSVKDNLTLWNSSINFDDIRRACRDAEIDGVINDLPQGFDTKLSEGGNSLSGGQRQRLEIARALVCDPTILIMDEATSALDAETERKVLSNLSNRGCTQVIVAHRLSTIRNADLILVMKDGNIVQEGTHDSMVLEEDSPYAQLLNESS
tara:strand:- start:236 stop:2452 length:2217 start_codon:yes stop_codon:yes gene_type:complete